MRFIARQPVFQRGMNVFGYELLFRAGFEEFANFRDSDLASRVTLDNSVLWGLDQLCGGKLALVNCTRAVLTERLIELLPPSRTVVEILEDIRPDPEVLQVCRSLKAKGYLIALDDVCSVEEVRPYLEVADLVKVDFRLTDEGQQAHLAQEFRARRITALAEKVETKAEFRAADHMGYQLFQGFFFQKPEIMRTRSIPALQVSYFRLLNAAQKPELDFALVEDVIRTEPSLCFRLLRYLNSPLFSFDFEVTSVGHALALIGEQEIRKWLMVSATAELGADKPAELVMWALTRARFCELTAAKIRQPLPGAFFMGMLSAFPALLEVPLDAILARLPVVPDTKAALLGQPGRCREILDMMTAYEQGRWSDCNEVASRIGYHEDAVASNYIAAVQWANKVTCRGTAAPAQATPVENEFFANQMISCR